MAPLFLSLFKCLGFLALGRLCEVTFGLDAIARRASSIIWSMALGWLDRSEAPQLPQ